jgi:DNA-binding CsgD family transcriptional regulator
VLLLLSGAEALLVHGGAPARSQAATILRRGLHLAEDLGARSIKVTPREREILELVVAGHTYGEIARALVISEKTVSSHISNLLRKTGTANRVDFSRLATRTAHANDILKR